MGEQNEWRPLLGVSMTRKILFFVFLSLPTTLAAASVCR
jgi:hypothetical protein